jgi:hypothetical protein
MGTDGQADMTKLIVAFAILKTLLKTSIYYVPHIIKATNRDCFLTCHYLFTFYDVYIFCFL